MILRNFCLDEEVKFLIEIEGLKQSDFSKVELIE